MQKVTIDKALGYLDLDPNLLPNLSVCGEVTSWQSGGKSFSQLELTDVSGSAVFQLRNSQKSQLKLNYLNTFVQIGVTLEISGLHKPASTWFKKGINFLITPDSPPTGTELSIHGSPKFSDWYKNQFPVLQEKKPPSKNIGLTTAADLYTQGISEKSFSQDNSKRTSSLKNDFFSANEQTSYLDDDSSDPNFYSGPNNFHSQKDLEPTYLPWQNYNWSMSREGQLLQQKLLDHTIFSTPVESNHPRLSLVFQFHPPEQGILSVYWLTAEKK